MRIEPGGMVDYEALARRHYRAGPPAVPDRVLRAIAEGEVVGVLVTARPTLNGGWRTSAWPGLAAGIGPGDRRSRARVLNAWVRTIARVVVAPSHRGMGVATLLVRAYLAKPATPLTEAVAVMGRYSGFFVSAGMRAWVLRPDEADRRLLAEVRARGLRPWALLSPDARARRAIRSMRPALERWARSGRGKSGRAGETLADLAARAGARLASHRAAFTAGRFGVEPTG